MKKIIVILGICSVILACNSSNKTSTTEDTASTTQDTVATLPADTTSATTQTPPADAVPTTPPAAATTPPAPKTTPSAPKTAEKPAVKPASTEKGQQMISKSDCLACHKLNEKLVGPAYTAVATKYDDTEANLNYLANKIISGGSGVWGEVPMTPHPTLSVADAKEMAKYVLSLK